MMRDQCEILEATDLAAAERILSKTYGDLRISARGRQRGMRLAQVQLTPAVRLDHNRFTMSFDATGTPLGVLAIRHLRSGLASYGSGDGKRTHLPGDVYLAFGADQAYTATVQEADLELAIIDLALPSQIADTEPGRSQQPVRFTGLQPVSLRAAQRWRDTYAYIRDTVLASPDAAAQPLLAATAARLLVATALATFPNNALTDPTSQDRHDAHSETVRRAVAFIDEHAHTDITVADVAAAAFVTIRAVQLAFQRHLGITPMEYLRQVRLDHAHRELLTADPAVVRITDVAHRWGFNSHSRFATRYRQAYGVTPSHTLRQD